MINIHPTISIYEQRSNMRPRHVRVKSINNPDKRVSLIKEFVKDNFPQYPLLDYALEVLYYLAFHVV